MSTTLVVVDHEGGLVDEISLQALTFGRSVAKTAGTGLEAVVIGPGAERAAAPLGPFGPAKVHVADHELLTDYSPDGWAAAVLQVMEATTAAAVLAAGTERGNELLAHVAARTGFAFAANCLSVEPDWSLTRVRWGGSLLEEARLDDEIKLLTVAPHSTIAAPADDGPAEAVPIELNLGPADVRVKVSAREKLAEGVTLTTAPVIVSGGRGVGSAEGFAVLEELAELLGGAVGCSRVATNNGWRPHRDQVGQTGARVAPELYIACGISGAIQHWVGCMASKRILAINTDADAPLVSKAHFAVIGDLHEVLGAVRDLVKAEKAR